MTNSYAGNQDAGEALLQSKEQQNTIDEVDVNGESGNKVSRGRKGSSSEESLIRNKEMDEFEHRQRQWYRLVIFDLVLWMFSVVCDCFFQGNTSQRSIQASSTGTGDFRGCSTCKPICGSNHFDGTGQKRSPTESFVFDRC